MAMNPTLLAANIEADLLARLASGGWNITGGPPSSGSQSGNVAVSPQSNIQIFCHSIAVAVADQVIIHLQTLATATGLDSGGDNHVLAIN